MKVNSNKLFSTHNNKTLLLIIYKRSMIDNINKKGVRINFDRNQRKECEGRQIHNISHIQYTNHTITISHLFHHNIYICMQCDSWHRQYACGTNQQWFFIRTRFTLLNLESTLLDSRQVTRHPYWLVTRFFHNNDKMM